MIQIKEYKGHIRNHKALMAELAIDPALANDRVAREQAILLKGYETWGVELPKHLHGMFALAI